MPKGTMEVLTAAKKGGTKIARQMKVLRTAAASYVEAYANSANINVSFYDIAIAFGVVTNVNEDAGEIEVRDSALIRMAPEHALSLLELLQAHVTIYENTFGPIRRSVKRPGDSGSDAPEKS